MNTDKSYKVTFEIECSASSLEAIEDGLKTFRVYGVDGFCSKGNYSISTGYPKVLKIEETE